jgi:quercetin dioxygenase-like cupin family protein
MLCPMRRFDQAGDRPSANNLLHHERLAITLSGMKLHWLFLLLALSGAAAFAQDAGKVAPVPVEVAAEPSHHLKIENEYVRAYFVELAPGQSTLMHHHGTDYVAVAIGAAEVDSVSPDGTTKHITFQDGQVNYAPAGVVHAVTDKGSAPFRNATIELLQNQGHPVCVKNCESDPRAKDWPALPDTAKAIGYGDSFRIIAVVIKPQQTASVTDPFPHLVVVLTDVQASFVDAGKPAQDVSHQAGNILFHQPHPPNTTATNSGAQDIRLVEIQFKPVKP